MKLKLSAIALLAMIMPVQARAATRTDAEATFLDQLVTSAAVLARRCNGYEVNGIGGVQLRRQASRQHRCRDGLMIDAFDAAITAHDGVDYDPGKFRP